MESSRSEPTGRRLTKRCKTCGENKPLSDAFWHRANDGTSFQVHCRPCFVERQRAHALRRKRAAEAPPVLRASDPTLIRIRANLAEARAFLRNSQTKLREGYLYVITNPAWPGYVKVGRAADYEDRLSSYQTGSPFRDYVLHAIHHVTDRIKAERRAHDVLQDLVVASDADGEWYKADADYAMSVASLACASKRGSA